MSYTTQLLSFLTVSKPLSGSAAPPHRSGHVTVVAVCVVPPRHHVSFVVSRMHCSAAIDAIAE
ncbi:Leucine--tRNA ligase, cytoplasmic [Sesbania bispinosa]|nr:Leucine--tRNA ligase, cytoplasmic [Sesbania bispinosa]